MKVSVDIPYRLLKKAVLEAEMKEGTCEVLPSARFDILDNFFGSSNEWQFSTLVCDQLGGKSTGVSAKYCANCRKPQSSAPSASEEAEV